MPNSPLNTIVTYVALAAGGYYLYTQFKLHGVKVQNQAAQNLELKIESVRPDASGLIMSVAVLNPNNTPMNVQSFVGKMKVDGKVVGDVSMFGDYTVKGNSEMPVPLTVSPYMQIFKSAFQNIRKGTSKIVFAGTINVNSKAIPITLSYQL